MTDIASGVLAVESSQNSKTGPISVTYAAQATCPSSCPFMGSGCYAETGPSRFTLNRINGTEATIKELATSEAEAIRQLSGWLPLRVHVVGDCPTDDSARIVASAMLGHSKKHGAPAWTYTHAWRDVRRESWQHANVIASCETGQDVKDAQGKGYSTALVVDHFEADKLYADKDGSKILPCPEQTGRTADCRSCGLCFKPELLEARRQKGISIGFRVHGMKQKQARQAIALRVRQ